ncbi:hypothetical protein HF82_06855 [Limosilactobacillus reuteri]|uniref:Uncharacterized protein n=1 Tax=Limosilactobacillus reuteri TaxID=1598 RepID=A0A073JJJ8_LIMRT|nr:hypothetical protein LR3_03595 [Limosilactobacillus reuteri]KEK14150.1 hypothetical protein HQ33_01315 [Limosilactobacillus reuteri]KEQ20954.1 hypothetical protein HF82_06855 [Limosilactobacillus reuteri]
MFLVTMLIHGLFLNELISWQKNLKNVVDDCEHIDLCDRVDQIPFNKIKQFFDEAFVKED